MHLNEFAIGVFSPLLIQSGLRAARATTELFRFTDFNPTPPVPTSHVGLGKNKKKKSVPPFPPPSPSHYPDTPAFYSRVRRFLSLLPPAATVVVPAPFESISHAHFRTRPSASYLGPFVQATQCLPVDPGQTRRWCLGFANCEID